MLTLTKHDAPFLATPLPYKLKLNTKKQITLLGDFSWFFLPKKQEGRLPELLDMEDYYIVGV